MSYYVNRLRVSDSKMGWIGPIRSHNQAKKEKAAWEDAGYEASIHESSPEIRKTVREWQKQANANR